jgi:hypothetical protein
VKEFALAEEQAISKYVHSFVQQSEVTPSSQTPILSEQVDPKFVGPLVVLAFITIFICCVSSAHCVRTARDCRIALNAMTIRREYQRNM